MKGKNKLVLVLFAVMALVATSVGFALKGMANEVRFANAASIPGFTAKLDGDVIFSTERVYFAVDGDGDSSNDYLTRQNPVEYKGYNFNSIMTNNGIEYFGDYALTNTYDYSNKKVVNNGDFVMANDKATYSMNSGEDEVIVKEGIMITLGGYYYNNHKTAVGTNAQKWDGSGFIGLDENEETGAGMTFVSAVQATLNGNPITLPNSRDYNNASNEDFTWFIVPSAATEGHYKISFLYSMKDFAEPVRYEFEFYLLLNSSYDTEVLVGESESAIRYSTKPNMMNSVLKNNREYEFYSGTTLNYPTLTFDYSRYDLSFTHTRGDETVEVDFEYDGNALNLTYELYGKSEPGPSYVVDADIDNTIVTLMFVEQGKYEFDFDYVYNKVSKVIIPQEQVPFENIKLNIYGYQLKYSKAGFTSADMTHLDIYKNGTMFILLDGYTNADDEKTGDSLGVSYSLIDTKTYRTGTIVDNANEIKNSGSESAMIVGGNADSVDALITNGIIDGLDYQRTDRGVWLTLKDEYVLENSFYYHRATRIDADYITLKNADSQQYVNRKDFTKVTTFTMPGYYLVQVKYKIDVNASETYTQYFAFQITATTPMLELYKTELEVLAGNSDDLKDKIDDFYAREFTNQNVYANWKDTEIFESKVSGKIYYVNGKYASESTLKSVADGKFNSSVTIKNYNKNTIIKDSGSYLLVLEVEKSATKTYTYFTIDKDPITGLEVYEVAINSIDNRAVYSIKQDQNLNYVTRTGAGAIDTAFTLFWNTKDKATVNDDTKSGAGITGTYRFTPFVVKSSYLEDNTISIERGDDLYKYLINNYMLGGRSESIQIARPKRLNIELSVENVLTDQGVYEFYLVDQAGNELNYIVVVDNTESVINATYGSAKTHYNSGQLVADYVELEWGTHKAIDLGNITQENALYKLINNQTIDKYYIEGESNLSSLQQMFVSIKDENLNDKNLYIAQNMYTNIDMDQKDYRYVLTYKGNQQIQYSNGSTIVGWDNDGQYLFENATNYGVKIKVDDRDNGEDHKYVFEVKGSNQISSSSSTKFTVRITPDETLGEVYSTSQEGGQYETRVEAKGKGTKYFGEQTEENVNHDKYYEGQASDDGIFVFEWASAKDEDNFKVTEVKYNYYQLMDQETLNTITKADIDAGKYPYYPYRYIEVSNNYILKTDSTGIETVSAYNKATRIVKDDKGNVVENRNINRSNAINLAYESYYNANNELITQQVTQTGLYIITRTIVMTSDENQTHEEIEYSYAFFVDRNMIVGYAINDVTSKIVGQFIHTAMPNSEAANGVKYDNFNKQGLKEKTETYYTGEKDANNNQKQETVKYKVYLETNKLPTLLQVPSGKYVSGNVDNRAISLTSYINLELRLSVYFKDTYKLLPYDYKTGDTGLFIQLMDGVTSNRHGYIELSYSNMSNPGIITLFRNARIQTNDNKLSLPGEYIFVIEDSVGRVVSENGKIGDVEDGNKFVFGIKLTNNAPETDVYTYAEINGNKSDNVYSENKILYTNQEFVDFIIPVEDMDAYQAQLDIATIEVWRSDIIGRPWLRLNPTAGGNGFEPDVSGYIQNIVNHIYWIDKDGNYIEQTDSDARERLAGYLIKLDTGVKVDANNVITEYGEYTYTINVKYVLVNTSYQYYQYKVDNQTISFYESTYVVEIDRSPNIENIDALMSEQGEYFEGYQSWLASENGTQINGELNKKVAYRNTVTLKDYYGVANDLYYQFARNSGDLSNQAMYAFTVDINSTFNPNGLSAIYYRRLKLADDSAIEADKRMGLLPITDIYGEGYYYSFNENMKAYNSFTILSNDAGYGLDSEFVLNGNIYYRTLMGLTNGSLEQYDNNAGMFYEIVEKDMAGNLTQYVIYFAPVETTGVSVKLEGKDIENTQSSISNLIFGEEDKNIQKSFIGINDVLSVDGLVGVNPNEDSQLYPYYANINIYNASRVKIKEIYTNATSIHNKYYNGERVVNGFEQEIYDVIKNEGNYILEFIDVFGDKLYLTINNYTSGEHNLNIATLQVQEDYATGQKYISFSGLNSKLNENTYWYVKEIEISYIVTVDNRAISKTIKYRAGVPTNGKSELVYIAEGSVEQREVWLHDFELDRLNLASNIQYMVKLTDVGGKVRVVPISTTPDYYAYQLNLLNNMYIKDDIYYTASEVSISYNVEHYDWNIVIEEDGVVVAETSINGGKYLRLEEGKAGYQTLKLLPDVPESSEWRNYYGSLRVFKVYLNVKNSENDLNQEPTYIIYIDTRATNFMIKNTHEVDKIDYVKSVFENGQNKDYNDENDIGLIEDKYYTELIAETVNVSWTRLTSDYFTYEYELFKFINKDEYKNLLLDENVNEYPIAPNDNDSTGKYVLKVTIKGKDGTWIASRIFGIYMSTTISGLYEVKDGLGNIYRDYSSITNLDEIYYEDNTYFGSSNSVTTALNLNFVKDKMDGSKTGDVELMQSIFNSFGRYTAIPMYISNVELILHPNADNGVSAWYCMVENTYTSIKFYRIWRSNYQTFAVIMYVKPETNKNVINTLTFETSDENNKKLLNGTTASTIYDSNAKYYQLLFNSYNVNTKANKLERHNKIMINVYYNDDTAKLIKGNSSNPISKISFKNSGKYKLEIRDTAGNKQYFSNQDFFTLVLMKKNDMLYTINNEAPVQYAYYNNEVTLQINRYNEATGKNNYDINTIRINVKRNSVNYTGYEHKTESTEYTFKEYGTYLITMSANLLETGEQVTSQLIFTIINPNEARTALDFTSIYGYNIVSVFNILPTSEKDVTEKFISLLKDKSNVEDVDVYNKLITYERAVEALGVANQGKMKLRVLYEVKNDDLLPSRMIEFTFTLNNEKATIISSIEAGGKTTKAVKLKFTGSIIYSQVGDCNLVINGEVVLRIDENSGSNTTEVEVTEVGEYYVQLVGDSGNVLHSLNFTIKQPLNTVSIILIVVVSAIAVALVGTFIWLRTRMKVR